MNERIVSIAQGLVRGTAPASLDGLAEEHGVSSRTIRNDIKTLNRFLAEKGLGQIELGRGGALLLSPDFAHVLSFLPAQGFYSYKMSSDERKKLAAVVLVEESGYVTIAEIAENFSVSRTTILNDLDGIKSLIRDLGLEVHSKPNRGLTVTGDERRRRQFLLDFALSGTTLSKQWVSATEFGLAQGSSEIIDKILNEQLRLRRAKLDDRSFEIARNYFAIAMRRCRSGNKIVLSDTDGAAIAERSAEVVGFARSVIALISQYSGIDMQGEGEVEFASRVLDEGGYRSSMRFVPEDVLVQGVTREFVKNVSRACGIDLNGDYTLFECLSNHLEAMFSSGPSRFPVNPTLREVVTDQPQALDAVKDNLHVLESYAGRRVTEVETIYVALHICASIERKRNMESRLRVVVVCDEGVGTSQLIVEELRGRFDIRVTKVIPVHEAEYLQAGDADLVISTAPIEGCPIDCVMAALPFTDRDYGKISSKIDEVRAIGGGGSDPYDRLGAQGLLDRIEPILRRGLSDGDGSIIRQVRIEVRRYFHEAQNMEEEILAPYLHQLLTPDHIVLDVKASDWKDAVAKSAGPLLELGYIEPRYVDAMIDNVVRNGPYIVLAPHFAIPHEAPEKGVNRMGMSLVRLARPVRFGAEGKDPVEFVCTLAPTDHKTHLKAFFNLLSMLSEPTSSIYQELREAGSPEQTADIIGAWEYKVI